jgi:L-ascorbate 6-phosphate lactonase
MVWSAPARRRFSCWRIFCRRPQHEHSNQARIEHLGQTGLRIDLGDLTVLVDPYLSHSVQELDAPDLVRQVPIPYQPHELTTVDWVLITHEHMDHCDPHTLPALAQASPQARFMGPLAVRRQLEQWGISRERIMPTPPEELDLGEGLSVQAIPAAHPKIRFDQDGQPQAVGYLVPAPWPKPLSGWGYICLR